jgi:Tfp pilus assembly protein PilF
MFLYHAGLIAMAGGRTEEGEERLRRALALNPNFAYPQAEDARRRLTGDPADSATNLPNVIH